MTAMLLEACLLHRPLIPQLNPLSLSVKPYSLSFLSGQVSFPRRINYRFSDPLSVKRRFLRHNSVISCTLDPENVNPAVESVKNSSCDFSESFLLTNQLDKKRLERLIEEADANPLDAAKQSLLFSELNKHSPESVIQRFEQRAHAVDSRGVAEYLRALVTTNAIAEYLPDEQSGKPSTLPSLLQELKQRASGDMEEPFVNPGVSEKQPLHMDPKVANRLSRLAKEIILTIVCTLAAGLLMCMRAAELRKYGVGSSSSYAPNELNEEIMPEKNVRGCYDDKQELEEVREYIGNPSKFIQSGRRLPSFFWFNNILLYNYY